MINKNPYLEKILDSKPSGQYDCCVLFSGGKDSTYLLFLLKEVYKKKVIAVTIDNGYEFDWMWKQTKEITDRLQVPHEIISESNNFKLLFESLIKDNDVFKNNEGKNYICTACNYLFAACALKYASLNDIPFVVTGLDPAQIFLIEKGREDANNLAEKFYRAYISSTKEKIKRTKNYNVYEDYKLFISETFTLPREITLLFPFVYLEYNTRDIKDVICREVGWKTPDSSKLSGYTTTGCKIADIVYNTLRHLEIAHPLDVEHLEKLYTDGAINTKELNSFKKKVAYGKTPKFLDFRDEIYDRLCIKEFLVNECKCRNIKYK